MSSTAKGYGLDTPRYSFVNDNWMEPKAGNAVLVSLVTCGKVEQVDGITSAPMHNQYHSRRIDKQGGADELVVFDEKQTLLAYVILF